LCLALAAPGRPASPGAPDFRLSLSVQNSDNEFREGFVFTDGEVTAHSNEELQRLFQKYGSTEMFARLNTGLAGLEAALDRARMAKRLGLAFSPHVGMYSSYGSMECQSPPDFNDYPEAKFSGEWTGLKLDAMLSKLRAYGAVVARAFAETGARLSVYDLGSETEYGFAAVTPQPNSNACYKDGHYRAPDAVDPEIGKKSVAGLLQMNEADRVAWLQAHLWPYEARMLAAVADGIHSVDPRARVSTTISGSTSLQTKTATAFFSSLKANGFALDEAGFSYNPTSTKLGLSVDRVKAFRAAATSVRDAIGKRVFIAEFAIPGAPLPKDHLWRNPVPGYPMTPEGQAKFIYDLVRWGVESRVLSGIRPWAPDGVTTGQYVGNSWGPMALFEIEGKTAVARPALKAFGRAIHAIGP
jgi:Glycosyl hydrolase family 53